MRKRHDRIIDRRFLRAEGKLPSSFGSALRWLREPSSRWLRIPVGVLLVLGGVFSFLPILGIWMLPLGILLLAQDVPALKEPTARALVWAERRWTQWRRRRSGGDTNGSPDP
ncbi:MAG TPA: hypothetical protein VK943_07020 [Arenibaculum sp.]|nr:hypothetical protein [Arenibaculum sp.]